MTTSRQKPFAIASNQGTIGGGEVMLLQIAEAARELGRDVTVVGPADPGELCDEARTRGFHTVRVPGEDTAAYLRNLRTWDRKHRRGLLWCNGLRPAFATSGHRHRVVHLHQRPLGKHVLLTKVARARSILTVVPSLSMANAVRGANVLPNWAPPLDKPGTTTRNSPTTIGFLGRLSTDKGVDLLAEAFQIVAAERPGMRLLLAGDARFVDPPVQAQIDRAIATLGDSVETPGWIDREHFFASVHLAVFPSRAPEAFGLVAAEAMAARCPFVVSDAGALAEVAGDGYPYVTPSGNVAALATTINRALITDNDDLIAHSYERWRKEYSPRAGLAALAELLSALPSDNWRSS